jgi:hypothetical protein
LLDPFRVRPHEFARKLRSTESVCGYAGLKQFGELMRENGLAEIISLSFVTLVSPKKRQLFLRLHALGDDPQFHASAQTYDGTHNGRIVGSRCDLTDKRLVDLQGIDWELTQIAQAGVTGTEIIDCNLYPSSSEFSEGRYCGIGALHQSALSHLQLK